MDSLPESTTTGPVDTGFSSSTSESALQPPVSLSSVLPRKSSFKPFKTHDEFLVAMKEDLSEWLNVLYNLDMDENTLMSHLDTGVLLCRHANNFNAVQLQILLELEDTVLATPDTHRKFPQKLAVSLRPSDFASVIFRENVKPGSFQSRVNISNFLNWCRVALRLQDTLLFESEDLVKGKNEWNVVLCLLEVARRGARIGMLAPSIIRMEAEIDAEIERDTNDGSEDPNGYQSPIDCAVQTDFDESGGEFDRTSTYSDSSFSSTTSSDNLQKQIPHNKIPSLPSTVGRRRPVIAVDMMSLDEMVRKILGQCTCTNQYPMIRVSEGKYKIGNSLTLIFVRILRNHVMVRIGGGWDTLENYLNRHDPCRMETRVTRTIVRNVTTDCTQHECKEVEDSTSRFDDDMKTRRDGDNNDHNENNIYRNTDDLTDQQNHVISREDEIIINRNEVVTIPSLSSSSLSLLSSSAVSALDDSKVGKNKRNVASQTEGLDISKLEKGKSLESCDLNIHRDQENHARELSLRQKNTSGNLVRSVRSNVPEVNESSCSLASLVGGGDVTRADMRSISSPCLKQRGVITSRTPMTSRTQVTSRTPCQTKRVLVIQKSEQRQNSRSSEKTNTRSPKLNGTSKYCSLDSPGQSPIQGRKLRRAGTLDNAYLKAVKQDFLAEGVGRVSMNDVIERSMKLDNVDAKNKNKSEHQNTNVFKSKIPRPVLH